MLVSYNYSERLFTCQKRASLLVFPILLCQKKEEGFVEVDDRDRIKLQESGGRESMKKYFSSFLFLGFFLLLPASSLAGELYAMQAPEDTAFLVYVSDDDSQQFKELFDAGWKIASGEKIQVEALLTFYKNEKGTKFAKFDLMPPRNSPEMGPDTVWLGYAVPLEGNWPQEILGYIKYGPYGGK